MAVTTQVEPITDAVHLCTDMQNIFAPGHIWETPWMERVLPRIVEIAARHPARTVFTRFITPVHADDRPGRWRRYFRKWPRATRAELPASELELVPALRRFAPPAKIIDKPAYSAFRESPLASFLSERGIGTLVVSGAETDVCVLATVLDAVDLGFRVVIVEDALCSSSDAGHDALMTLYRTRFSEQIELIKAAELPALWPDAACTLRLIPKDLGRSFPPATGQTCCPRTIMMFHDAASRGWLCEFDELFDADPNLCYLRHFVSPRFRAALPLPDLRG